MTAESISNIKTANGYVASETGQSEYSYFFQIKTFILYISGIGSSIVMPLLT